MGMQNDGKRTPVDGGWLPFRLLVLEGSGELPKPLPSLTRNPHRFADHMLKVTELLPLELRVEGDKDDVKLEFLMEDEAWDEDAAGDGWMWLAPGHPLVLYRPEGDEPYPWRCGRYRFKIRFADETYYGGIEIVPKNVDEAQLKSMHELIEKHVRGLTYDYFHSNFHDGSGHPLYKWHKEFLEWYRRNEKMLLSALKKIEQEHDWGLVPVYLEELRQTKPDLQCVRWAVTHKGLAAQGRKFLNRRMLVTNDTLVNRYVKWRVRKLEKLLVEARDFFTDIKKELEKDELERAEKMEHAEEQLRQFANDVRVYKKYLAELQGQLEMLRKLQREGVELRGEIDQYLQGIEQLLLRLRGVLSSPFWREIQEEPVSAKMGFRNPSYLVVDQILRESEQRFERPKEGFQQLLPAQRPTPLLYEYYVYFTLMDIAKELGWTLTGKPSLPEQTIVYEGLPDGYTVCLRKGDEELRLVFNEEVYYGGNQPLVNQGYFYTTGSHRKPDIRIERHRLALDLPLRFQEAWIIEVKYRPLRNIYSEEVLTSTEGQLCNYKNFGYTWKSGNGRAYPRESSVVKKVICVYPGSKAEHEQVLILTNNGVNYLQLCPEGDSVRGKDELRNMMKEWLG